MKNMIALFENVAEKFIPILCQIGGSIFIGLGFYGIIRCMVKGNLRKGKIIICLVGLIIGIVSLKFNVELSQWFMSIMM